MILPGLPFRVMPGLVPGIHAVPQLRRFLGRSLVDGRVEPGHDGGRVVGGGDQ